WLALLNSAAQILHMILNRACRNANVVMQIDYMSQVAGNDGFEKKVLSRGLAGFFLCLLLGSAGAEGFFFCNPGFLSSFFSLLFRAFRSFPRRIRFLLGFLSGSRQNLEMF